jgi:hypothetical protein
VAYLEGSKAHLHDRPAKKKVVSAEADKTASKDAVVLVVQGDQPSNFKLRR